MLNVNVVLMTGEVITFTDVNDAWVDVEDESVNIITKEGDAIVFTKDGYMPYFDYKFDGILPGDEKWVD